jgi:hypothetical protein
MHLLFINLLLINVEELTCKRRLLWLQQTFNVPHKRLRLHIIARCCSYNILWNAAVSTPSCSRFTRCSVGQTLETVT